MDGQYHAPAAFTPGRVAVPILQEAGWAWESVWIGAQNLAPTGIRSPDLPSRSESLYRLRHPDFSNNAIMKCIFCVFHIKKDVNNVWDCKNIYIKKKRYKELRVGSILT